MGDSGLDIMAYMLLVTHMRERTSFSVDSLREVATSLQHHRLARSLSLAQIVYLCRNKFKKNSHTKIYLGLRTLSAIK